MNYSLHIPRPSLTGSTTSTRSGSSIHSFSDTNSYVPAGVGIHNSSSRNLLLNNQQQQLKQQQTPPKSTKKHSTNMIYKNDRRNSLSSSSTTVATTSAAPFVYDRKMNHQSGSGSSGINNSNNNSNKIKQNKQRYNEDRFNKSMDDRFNYNKINKYNNYEYDIGQIKRGSRSSQGSTDSNNSTGTASSGSLLLTTANLERFVAIHNNNSSNNTRSYFPNATNSNHIINNKKPIARTDQQLLNTSIDSANTLNIYTIANNHINNINDDSDTVGTNKQISTIQTNNSNNNNIIMDDNQTILEIDPNLHFIKTKDVDAVSIASSTHFTMVNGVGGPQRKTKSNGICSRGHQLTVLILTMSTLFLIGILLMVYLMEMRARDMPQM